MMEKICCVAGCERPGYCREMCEMHYWRWRKYGNPGSSDRWQIKPEQHRMTGTRVHKTWNDMRQRCSNPRNRSYQYYGGRGIIVCEKWKNSFTAFYKDMGNPPSSKHQIDRINSDGNYEPTNCRWVLSMENCRHRRNTKLNIEKAQKIRFLKSQGSTTKELMRKFNISLRTVYDVLNGKTWAGGINAC